MFLHQLIKMVDSACIASKGYKCGFEMMDGIRIVRCEEWINNFSTHQSHLKKHSCTLLSSENSWYVCPFCEPRRRLGSAKTWKNHISLKHDLAFKKALNLSYEERGNMDNEINISEDPTWNMPALGILESPTDQRVLSTDEKFCALLVYLQNKYSLPETSANSLVTEVLNFAGDEVKKVCESSESLEDARMAIDEKYKGLLRIAKSRYLQNTLLELSGKPQVTHLEPFHGTTLARRYSLISLKNAISRLLAIESVRTAVLDNLEDCSKYKSKTPKIYHDFKDGTNFDRYSKDHLRIQLYLDDFGVGNPLSHNARSQTLTGVYFTIENLPYKSQTQADQINVLMALPRTLFEQRIVQSTNVYEVIKQQICELVEGDGIFVEDKGRRVQIKCRISSIVVDNLAAHGLMGLSKNWYLGWYCRYCFCSRSQAQERLKVSMNKMETDPQILTTERFTYTPFHTLPAFSILHCLPPDIMHDLNEGCIPNVLQLILLNMCSSSDIAEINSNFKNMPWPNRMPAHLIKNKEIRGTAAQKMDFFLNFPCLIPVSLINHQCMKVYFVFKKIVLAVEQLEITEEEVQELENDIDTFFALFVRVFRIQDSEAIIKPKLHHILHYPSLIRRFGPLKFYSAFRYERRHQSLKNVAHAARSRKNISLILANRSWKYFHAKSMLQKSKTSSSSEKRLDVHDIAILKSLFKLNDKHDAFSFYKVTTIVIESVKFIVGRLMVIERIEQNHNYDLAMIWLILKKGGLFYILAEMFKRDEIANMGIYRLFATDKYVFLDPKTVIHYKPLECFHGNNVDELWLLKTIDIDKLLDRKLLITNQCQLI